jgi:DNA-binding response OmpR family regulator
VLIAGRFTSAMAAMADRILRSHGAVLWCTTCRDAIRCLAERRIGLVLCARVLPDGGWTNIERALRRAPSHPPLVVISAGDDPVS